MYDSDKRIALSMYEKMFDDGPNDDAVIQYLNSPTRQAVNIAHSYDAKERKESFENDVKEGDDVPEFVDAIADIAEGIYRLGDYSYSNEPRFFKNQMSIFGDSDSVQQPPSPPSNIVVDEPYSPKSSSSKSDRFDITLDEPYQLKDEVDNVSPSPFTNFGSLEDDEPLPAPNYPKDSIFNDPFYAKAIRNGAPVPEPTEPVVSANNETSSESIKIDLQEDSNTEDISPAPRKTIVPLLLLYIIFATPITALFIVVLLIIAALFFAASAAVIYIGFQALMAAFSNFSVFADIMVVLGTALAVIALGLLLLWIGIWLIGGAIVGLVKSAIRIGEKFSTKEDKS